MRLNKEAETVDMEERDIQFIISAYIRSYNYFTKGQDPKEIIFPMFTSAEHPRKPGVRIPIRYIPVESPKAQEIAVDGSNVPITSETELAKKDEEIRKLKEMVESLQGQPDMAYEPAPDAPTPEEAGINPEEEAARADLAPAPEEPIALPPPIENEEVMEAAISDKAGEERPPYEIPEPDKEQPTPPVIEVKQPERPATGHPDSMHPRLRTDQIQAVKDLIPEPDVDEDKEKPYEKPVARDEHGEIKIEEG